MPGLVGINRYGRGVYGVPPTPSWPPRVSPNGRYLVDGAGAPLLVADYALWTLSCVSSMSDLNSIIAELLSLRINAVHVSAYVGGTCETGTPPNIVSVDMFGNLPFLKNNDGTTFTSTYGGNADVSQTNDAYFQTVATIVTALQRAGILVLFHPCYLGFGIGVQGMGTHMLNSGSTKVNTYATYMAGKFPHPNIVWMPYGDNDPRNETGMAAIHASFWNTLIANAKQSPLLVGGHFPVGNGDPTSANNTDTGGSPTAMNAIPNIVTDYHWNAGTDDTGAYTNMLTASQVSPARPTIQHDPACYEGVANGPVGGDATTARKDWWWRLLSSTAGAGWANALTSNCGSTDGSTNSFTFANCNVPSGFGSDGHKHLRIGIQIYQAIPWWELLPAGVGSMGTIVSSGSGSSGTQTFIASAATPDGTVCVAYVPPAIAASSSITIASGIMQKAYTAYWVDPTAGLDSATVIGHFGTGAQSFTTPSGTNSYGTTDWLLVLRA